MTKTFTTEDFANWGKQGAAIANSKLTSKTRRKAALKAWTTKRKRAKQGSK